LSGRSAKEEGRRHHGGLLLCCGRLINPTLVFVRLASGQGHDSYYHRRHIVRTESGGSRNHGPGVPG
jgi:hypothetical protein